MRYNGFTLLGLIIVVAVVAALSASVYYLVNPQKRIIAAKNAVRVQDAEALEKAIKSALLDNDTPPEAITNISEDTYYSLIVDGGIPGVYTCSELGEDILSLDIASTVTPFLGASLPVDPDISSGSNTGYYLVRKGNLFDIGYCNWSREAICGDGYCISGESCSSCEADCGSCNQPPVVSDAGRDPANLEANVAVTTNLTWSAWTHPLGSTVEYYTELHYNTATCNASTPTTFTWSTNTYADPVINLRGSRTYSWHVKGRTQGENDDTAYNTCYSFVTADIFLP